MWWNYRTTDTFIHCYSKLPASFWGKFGYVILLSWTQQLSNYILVIYLHKCETKQGYLLKHPLYEHKMVNNSIHRKWPKWLTPYNEMGHRLKKNNNKIVLKCGTISKILQVKNKIERKILRFYDAKSETTVWASPRLWSHQDRTHYHINDVQMSLTRERQRSENLIENCFSSSVWGWKVTEGGSFAGMIVSQIPKQSWKGVNY